MSGEFQLSPSQCKRARALLKWNFQDLASRTHIDARQIEKFERAELKLQRPENDLLVKLFLKHDVTFAKNGDVALKVTKAAGPQEEQRIVMSMHNFSNDTALPSGEDAQETKPETPKKKRML